MQLLSCVHSIRWRKETISPWISINWSRFLIDSSCAKFSVGLHVFVCMNLVFSVINFILRLSLFTLSLSANCIYKNRFEKCQPAISHTSKKTPKSNISSRCLYYFIFTLVPFLTLWLEWHIQKVFFVLRVVCFCLPLFASHFPITKEYKIACAKQ